MNDSFQRAAWNEKATPCRHDDRMAGWSDWRGWAVRFSTASLAISLLSWQSPSASAGDIFKQPDGKVVELKPLRAGETTQFEDAQGFTVVRIPIRFEYAMPAKDGGLKPSGIELRSMDPTKSALPLRLMPTLDFLQQRRKNSPAGIAPPSPLPVEVKLADGSVVQLKFKGSGAYSWYEDDQGYSVVTTPERFEYALRGPTGQLIPCGILAGSMNPAEAGLRPGIRPGAPAR